VGTALFGKEKEFRSIEREKKGGNIYILLNEGGIRKAKSRASGVIEKETEKFPAALKGKSIDFLGRKGSPFV